MIDYNFFYSGPLLFNTTIKESDLIKIDTLCNSSTDYSENLAGAINSQNKINELKYREILNPYLETYKQSFEQWYGEKPTKNIVIEDAWINLMQANDFQPPHIHPSCYMASVLFLSDLNDTIKKEREDYKGTHPGGPASLNFIFSANQMNNFIQERHFVPSRGEFYIFPGGLYHWVFPYKSEFTRISIAANFNFER
jgi:uncharacterized protein (TIGR02466 family)